MSSVAEKIERQDRILARLADLGESLAENLHARAVAAETAAEAERLGLAFHRVCRGIRQTLALGARLEREWQRLGLEARREAERQADARIKQRKAQIQLPVARAVRTEHDGDEQETEHLIEHLEKLLEEDALDPGFLDRPIAALIAQLHIDLNLKPPAVDADLDPPEPVEAALRTPTDGRAPEIQTLNSG